MDDSGFRLKHFLSTENIQQKFVASELGKAPQYINAICQGRRGVGKKNAAKLQELYGVNAGWLLTGEGTMYSRQRIIQEETNNNSVVSEQDNEEVKPIQNLRKGKPYYNVDFRLGFDILENDQTRLPDYLIDFPPYNDCDCWVNAHGDSMSPTISSGDIVALKRIPDFRYLINGEIYAIVTTNGLRTIKRIRDDGDTFTLVADNPTVGTQSIPKHIVTHVFHVRGSIKMF